MRYLGSAPGEVAARRFSDYLLSVGIRNQFEAGRAGYAVWVERDDDMERARQEMDAYLRNPGDARYGAAAAPAAAARGEQQVRQRQLEYNHIDVRTSWAAPPRRRPMVTVALIVLSVLATLGIQFGEKPDPVAYQLMIADTSPQRLRQLAAEQRAKTGRENPSLWLLLKRAQGLPANPLSEVRHGQVWRLVTPIFLHLSPLHLLFNMWWLWGLGRVIEARRGAVFMGLLVLLSAVVPNLMQYAWAGPKFGGMSGVVYALFGYIWITGLLDVSFGVRLTQQTVIIMLAWLVLCMTGMLGPVANAAHLGGLVVGAAMAAGMWMARRPLRRAGIGGAAP